MKFVIFFVLAAFVAVQALTPEEKEVVKKYYGECYKDTGADQELTKKVKQGDWTIEDDKVKKFFFCMCKKVGIMDEQANMLRDKAVDKVPESEKADVGRVLDLCKSKTGASPFETAWNYCKCYDQARPGREDFF